MCCDEREFCTSCSKRISGTYWLCSDNLNKDDEKPEDCSNYQDKSTSTEKCESCKAKKEKEEKAERRRRALNH